jgi:hypothetical protein
LTNKRLYPYGYTLHEPFKQKVDLMVQPCMRHYRFRSEHSVGNYHITIYENLRVSGMLTVWSRRLNG